jgi:ribosomal protein S18 acetylase RimI-like enzyme
MSNLLTTFKGVITIRSAVPDDAALLRELRLESLASHPKVFAADHASTAAEPVEVWVERIAEYALDNKGVICVASTENQLIGMIGLVRGHWPKTRHSGTLWGVYVKAEWRGFYVAEALVKECIAWAQAQGLAMVKLAVITTNTSAIRCYARCGFTIYGIDPKVIYYNDVFYEELLMAKPI